DLAEALPARVEVAVGALADLAPEELVERHPRALALDVPEGDVDAAHRVEEHEPVPPVGADVARLPDVLDLVAIAADPERLQVLLDRGLDREGALGERGAAPAVEPGLARLHPDHHEADAVGRGQDRPDVADLHGRGGADRALVLRAR